MAKRNFNNNSNSRGNRDQGSGKKHTGAKKGFTKTGEPYTHGWNYSRRHGMTTFLAVPYKGSKLVTSASGRQWVNVMVKVSRDKEKPFIVSGMRDDQSGMVTIQELGMVINPNAKNGGYCGKY